jgi:GTPase Era involved in 16S rRNA processing
MLVVGTSSSGKSTVISHITKHYPQIPAVEYNVKIYQKMLIPPTEWAIKLIILCVDGPNSTRPLQEWHRVVRRSISYATAMKIIIVTKTENWDETAKHRRRCCMTTLFTDIKNVFFVNNLNEELWKYVFEAITPIFPEKKEKQHTKCILLYIIFIISCLLMMSILTSSTLLTNMT